MLVSGQVRHEVGRPGDPSVPEKPHGLISASWGLGRLQERRGATSEERALIWLGLERIRDASLQDPKRSMGDFPGRRPDRRVNRVQWTKSSVNRARMDRSMRNRSRTETGKERCDFDVVARLKEGNEETLKNGVHLVGRFAWKEQGKNRGTSRLEQRRGRATRFQTFTSKLPISRPGSAAQIPGAGRNPGESPSLRERCQPVGKLPFKFGALSKSTNMPLRYVLCNDPECRAAICDHTCPQSQVSLIFVGCAPRQGLARLLTISFGGLAGVSRRPSLRLHP